MASINSAFRQAYDETNNELKTTTVAGTSTSQGTTHDVAGILRRVFDDTTQTIRVISV